MRTERSGGIDSIILTGLLLLSLLAPLMVSVTITSIGTVEANPGDPSENWVVVSYSPQIKNYAVAVVGAGGNIYIANSTTSYTSYFWRYNPSDNTWDDLAVPSGLLWKPGKLNSGEGAFKNGTFLAWDNGNYIYTLFGASYADGDQGYYRHYFYRYSIPNDNWEQLDNTPSSKKGQGAGDAITWVPGNVLGTETDWIYAVVGSKEGKHGTIFCRYNINDNSWETLPYNSSWSGGGSDDGSSLVWAGGDNLYALQGEWHESSGWQDRKFARFDLTDNSWSDLPDIPEEGGVGDGGSLVWVGGSYSDNIYALGGGATAPEDPGENFYCYSISDNSWTQLPDLPYGITEQNGPRLGYANENIYCWRGHYQASEGPKDVLWAYAVPIGWSLASGWNLVGFHHLSASDTPGNMLDGIEHYVWYLDVTWKLLGDGEPFEPGVGYWVWLSSATTTGTTGPAVDNHTLDLIAGWNLVSVPVTSDNTTPENLFSGIEHYVWYLDVTWKLLGDGEPFELGVGYWVWLENATTVTVPL